LYAALVQGGVLKGTRLGYQAKVRRVSFGLAGMRRDRRRRLRISESGRKAKVTCDWRNQSSIGVSLR